MGHRGVGGSGHRSGHGHCGATAQKGKARQAGGGDTGGASVLHCRFLSVRRVPLWIRNPRCGEPGNGAGVPERSGGYSDAVPEVLDVFPRAWIEFPDPADGDQTIRADLTWLTSRWTCIYGNGCQGIDAAMPDAGCCTHGAHFADAADEKRVKRWVARLTEDEWELKPPGRSGAATGSRPTRRSAQNPGGRRCLASSGELAALRRGCRLRPAPARHEQRRVLHRHQTRRVLAVADPARLRLGRIQRWHPTPGHHHHRVPARYVGRRRPRLPWYCSSNTEAHVGVEPVYLSNRDELVALIGPAAYAELARHCAQHEAARAPLAVHPQPPRARLRLTVGPLT